MLQITRQQSAATMRLLDCMDVCHTQASQLSLTSGGALVSLAGSVLLVQHPSRCKGKPVAAFVVAGLPRDSDAFHYQRRLWRNKYDAEWDKERCIWVVWADRLQGLLLSLPAIDTPVTLL